MSSMIITCTNSQCGASMKVSRDIEGKKVRCPKCSTVFTARSNTPAQEELPLAFATEPEKKCPNCEASMQPEAILCLECGFNLKTGQKLERAKKTPKKQPASQRTLPESEEDLPAYLEEAETLIELARKELWRVPYVLGLGDDPDMVRFRQVNRNGRCANPNCRRNVEGGMLSSGNRAGTSVVKFTAMGTTMVLDLCEDCTVIILEDLASRDKTALQYLKEARKDLDRAAKRFPKNQQIDHLYKQHRKAELLAGAEKPKRRMCFIATAAYGSPLADEVDTLRRYRDDILERTTFGRWLVRVYECLSPPMADVIARSSGLRFVVRQFLRPIIAWAARRLAATNLNSEAPESACRRQ